jgi:hypothetical protein
MNQSKRICWDFEPDYPDMNERSGCRKYVDKRLNGNYCWECGQGHQTELIAAHSERDDTGQNERNR